MSTTFRPYIGKVATYEWFDRITQVGTPGIMIAGLGGIAAHLTKAEAFHLCNEITDLAEQLPDEQETP